MTVVREEMIKTVWVDGPLHPDLFDGETPIRILVTVDVVQVFPREEMQLELLDKTECTLTQS